MYLYCVVISFIFWFYYFFKINAHYYDFLMRENGILVDCYGNKIIFGL